MSSGDTLIIFSPQSNEPPTSNYATLDIRNNNLVLDFDASTDESAIFSGILPRQYSGNGLTVQIAWMATTATSNKCGWDGSFERHEDDVTDLDSDSFYTPPQSVSTTTSSSAGEIKYSEIVFTNSQIDGLLAGEHFRFKLTRDTSVTNDLTDDVELLSVEIRET